MLNEERRRELMREVTDDEIFRARRVTIERIKRSKRALKRIRKEGK